MTNKLKDDIERLKKWLMCNPAKEAGELIDFIDEVRAHLDQPFQWGDEVEIQIISDNAWHSGYKYVGKSNKDAPPFGRQYIVEKIPQDNKKIIEQPYYVLDIRHPKQTVQVTLDKEAPRIAKEILATIDEHHACCVEQVITLCKAIAQEGEDK